MSPAKARILELCMSGLRDVEIAAEVGVSREWIRQVVTGTEEAAHREAMRQEDRDMRAAREAAEREARRAQAAARKTEPCRTCGGRLRASLNYSRGECRACRTYRLAYGVTRPAYLHGLPTVPKQAKVRSCGGCGEVSAITARGLCESCYQRAKYRAKKAGTWDPRPMVRNVGRGENE